MSTAELPYSAISLTSNHMPLHRFQPLEPHFRPTSYIACIQPRPSETSRSFELRQLLLTGSSSSWSSDFHKAPAKSCPPRSLAKKDRRSETNNACQLVSGEQSSQELGHKPYPFPAPPTIRHSSKSTEGRILVKVCQLLPAETRALLQFFA